MMGKMKPNRVSRMAEVKLGKPKAIKSALEGERRALKGTVPLRTVWKRDLNMLMASSHPGSSMTGLRDKRIYPDSELFISCTLPLLRCHET